MDFRFFTVLAAMPMVAVAWAEPKQQPVFSRSDERINLASPAVAEASGLAVSPSDPAFQWVVNDSGSSAEIHLAGSDGTDRGKLKLNDVKGVDWEDLASFSLDGKFYLLVSDTGDNNATRDSCVLHIIREPSLPAPGQNLDATAATAWQIRFTYEDGPRDCEAVAVDATAGKVILVTKRTNPPEVHELPLRAPAKRGVLTTRRIGTVSVKAPASIIPFLDQPTGLDISADGTLAAIVTYHSVFLFPRVSGESWADAFARPAVPLKPHLLAQAESIAFSRDAKTIYTTSEGKNPRVIRYSR